MAQASIPARTLRAIEEYHSVLREAEDLYLVVSESGKEYIVDLQEPACTCPDFSHREVVCKHIRRVRLETGVIDPDDVKQQLSASAETIETEAETLVERADGLRETAERLRRTLDRLETITEENRDSD